MRSRWDLSMLAVDCHASLSVGTGREAGSARGARGGGSRKIWCCADTLLCLYLWPLRWPMFLGS
jgi:hypothetical protein